MSQTTQARPRSKLLTKVALLTLVAGAVVAVVLSYTWFIDPATESIDTVGTADAVVVFAGSLERIETAMELMERGAAPNLVIPNGHSDEIEDHDLCDRASFQVYCPDAATIDTMGEAQVIGRLAEERGWSSLIAVTSSYHVHRATYQLGLCHDGPIQAVASNRDIDREDLVESMLHEWAGTIAAMTVQRAC